MDCSASVSSGFASLGQTASTTFTDTGAGGNGVPLYAHFVIAKNAYGSADAPP